MELLKKAIVNAQLLLCWWLITSDTIALWQAACVPETEAAPHWGTDLNKVYLFIVLHIPMLPDASDDWTKDVSKHFMVVCAAELNQLLKIHERALHSATIRSELTRHRL
jgi:hypothetical protein